MAAAARSSTHSCAGAVRCSPGADRRFACAWHAVVPDPSWSADWLVLIAANLLPRTASSCCWQPGCSPSAGVSTSLRRWTLDRPLGPGAVRAVSTRSGTVTWARCLDVVCVPGELCRLAVDRVAALLGGGVQPGRVGPPSAARLFPSRVLAGSLPRCPSRTGRGGGDLRAGTDAGTQSCGPPCVRLTRVARPGAPVVVTVLGPVEQCAFRLRWAGLARFLVGRCRRWRSGQRWAAAADAPGRFASWACLARPGRRACQDVRCHSTTRDERALLAGL